MINPHRPSTPHPAQSEGGEDEQPQQVTVAAPLSVFNSAVASPLTSPVLAHHNNSQNDLVRFFPQQVLPADGHSFFGAALRRDPVVYLRPAGHEESPDGEVADAHDASVTPYFGIRHVVSGEDITGGEQ